MNSICIGLNIQGFNPSPNSKSGWKLPKMREEISSLQKNNYFIPFVAIVESWLRPEIADAQINITGFFSTGQRKNSTRWSPVVY